MRKENGLWFLLGAGICKYLSDKISRNKDSEIQRKNRLIEVLDRWMTLRDQGISVEKYLKEIGCKKAAIYGLGIIGNHLYEELRRTEIEIVGIDHSDIYDNFRMPIYKPDDHFEDIDAIIVTPFEYDAVCRALKEYRGRILSFQQLLNECEAYLWK